MIKKWKEYIKNKDTIDSLVSSIPDLPEPKRSEKELKYLSDLSRLEVVTLPTVSSESANLLIKRKTLTEQLGNFKIVEIDPQRSTEEILVEMRKIENRIREIEENQRQIAQQLKLEKEIEKLQAD